MSRSFLRFLPALLLTCIANAQPELTAGRLSADLRPHPRVLLTDERLEAVRAKTDAADWARTRHADLRTCGPADLRTCGRSPTSWSPARTASGTRRRGRSRTAA